MTVLADTSIWVDFLRHGRRGRAVAMDELLARHELALCGPVLAELLAGASGAQAKQLAQLWRLLPWTETGRRDWEVVGVALQALRHSGVAASLPWPHFEQAHRCGPAIAGSRVSRRCCRSCRSA